MSNNQTTMRDPFIAPDDDLVWKLLCYMLVGTMVFLAGLLLHLAWVEVMEQPWWYIRGFAGGAGASVATLVVGYTTVAVFRRVISRV